VPLRDFNKVVHRVAVTGVPDEQSRLFFKLIVFIFLYRKLLFTYLYVWGKVPCFVFPDHSVFEQGPCVGIASSLSFFYKNGRLSFVPETPPWAHMSGLRASLSHFPIERLPFQQPQPLPLFRSFHGSFVFSFECYTRRSNGTEHCTKFPFCWSKL
jgi:hypothetical protein